MATDSPYPAIRKVLVENKEEIGKAVRSASEAHEKLVGFLGIDALNSEGRLNEIRYEIGKELQYYLDVFDAYIDAGPRLENKRRRMDLFAENYQQHPEQVYELLRHFGLEI